MITTSDTKISECKCKIPSRGSGSRCTYCGELIWFYYKVTDSSEEPTQPEEKLNKPKHHCKECRGSGYSMKDGKPCWRCK